MTKTGENSLQKMAAHPYCSDLAKRVNNYDCYVSGWQMRMMNRSACCLPDCRQLALCITAVLVAANQESMWSPSPPISAMQQSIGICISDMLGGKKGEKPTGHTKTAQPNKNSNKRQTTFIAHISTWLGQSVAGAMEQKLYPLFIYFCKIDHKLFLSA